MIIPVEKLSKTALRGLIEAFITREGTDYGLEELSLEHKVEQVYAQLLLGKVLVVFDATTESANLMTLEQYQHSSMKDIGL